MFGNFLKSKVLEGFFKKSSKTPTGTDLNRSPRQVSINQSRTTTMSDASAKGRKTFALQKGGSVIARGNKLAKSKPTKLY
jgi:hypothetical protein